MLKMSQCKNTSPVGVEIQAAVQHGTEGLMGGMAKASRASQTYHLCWSGANAMSWSIIRTVCVT